MTILIADDNALIRNWLKIMLNQADPTNRLLEAVDGDEAYDICMSNSIDLLITDIRMPGKDGMELIRALSEEKPDILTAVLTSYDDFSYIRIALKNGVLDYILKAEMKQDDITALLNKAASQLSARKSDKTSKASFLSEIQEARRAYETLMDGKGQPGSGLLDACKLSEAASPLLLVMLTLDGAQLGDIISAAAESCCEFLPSMNCHGLFFPVDGHTLLGLSSMPCFDELPPQEAQLRFLSTLSLGIQDRGYGSMRQNVTLLVDSAGELPDKIRQAKAMLDYQTYYSTYVIPNGTIPPRSGKEVEFLQILSNLLNVRDSGQACHQLQKYILFCHGIREFPYRIRRAVAAATQMMLNYLHFTESKASEYRVLDRLASEINESKTESQMKLLTNQFCMLYEEYAGQARKINSPAISQAMSYCNDHYAEKITLEKVATVVGLNKSYFSQLFHKEAGIPFGDYLESVRIQHAQQLLKNMNYSMSDIAEQVGFADQNYFTKVFKKQTGTTPSIYRKSLFQTAGATE